MSSSEYKTLDAPETESWGTARRAFVVGSAVIACLLNTGLVFGYSALFPDLVTHGAFHDDCDDDDSGSSGTTCRGQLLALSGMFTLATSALNLAGMPTGALLDYVGPSKNAAISALLTGLGCVIFSLGGPGAGQYAYDGGFLLMAIFGPPVFVSTLSFTSLFPKRAGLITAALVGCFDASSAVFVWLHAVIAEGFSFSTTLAGYAAAPLLVALIALTQWPRRVVEASEGGNDGGEEEPNLCKLSARAWALDTLPLSAQLCSPVYLALVHTVSVNMVCINFFIATVNDQMLAVPTTSASTSASLAATFAWMLPAGGIIYIPLVGMITDRLGPTGGYAILVLLLLAFAALNAAYASSGDATLAYSAFTVFALCRPLFYTLGAGFTGQFFGFANFGKIYGLLFTLAGVANLAVQPLHVLAEDRGFGTANSALVAMQLTTVVLPLVVIFGKKRPSGKGFRPISPSGSGNVMFASPGLRADGVRRMSASGSPGGGRGAPVNL